MILCEISADWVSAIISGMALLGTVYTLYSTRKDSDEIQKQVDSLAKMANLYQKNRRDEINPSFVIDDFKQKAYDNSIAFRNIGQTAYDFTVLSAKFVGLYEFKTFEPPENVLLNELRRLHFPYDIEIMNKVNAGDFEFEALIQFKNKDNECFEQKIHRKRNGFNTPYPPNEINCKSLG